MASTMVLFELLVKLLVCMLECYLIFDFFKNITDIRESLSKKNVLVIAALTVLVHFGINLANDAMVNLIGFIIIYLSFTTILFDMNMKIRIFYFIIAIILNLFCEIIYMVWLEFSTNMIFDGPGRLSDNLLQIIVIKFLTYIVYMLVKRIPSKKNKLMPNDIFAMYMCLPIASHSMMLTVFYSGVNFEENPHQKVMIILCSTFMLFANILVFYAFNKHAEQMYQNSRRDMAAIKQDCEQMHQQDILRKNEQHNERIHNIINHLKTLEILVQADEKEQAKGIISQLNEEFEKNTLSHYSSNQILNALLSDKEFVAKEQDVLMDILVEPGVNLGQIKDIDLIAMLGNLLDNAIRAAGECEQNKEVRVRMYMQNNGNVFVAKLENHYVKMIEAANGELKTTKQESGIHGLGIKSVVGTADKYDGYLKYSAKDNKFTAILILPI